ncbi:MAG: hypothetical protein E6G02_14600 [Actinobacteria bacterium]|nr:MAG: hypothetical protein E6G02_14600 [Actinomycetota bacterium]
MDRRAGNRVRGRRGSLGGRGRSGGAGGVRTGPGDGRLFRRPRRLAGVLDPLVDRGRPDLELRQSLARLPRVPAARAGGGDDAAGAAVRGGVAHGRDGGGDRLGARDEDLPRAVGGDRAGGAPEQPDRLLERARAADRVRSSPGAVDCGASRPAGLAARGRGRLPLCGARRVGADVLSRRRRRRDRGGRALDCDRAAAAGECGCACNCARADARRLRLGFLTSRADVLGGIAAFAAAFFIARYETRQPLTEPWRLRLGRAAVLAVVVAAVFGVGALLAAGITPSRVLHKFNEPTPASAAQGANNLTNLSSSSRWNWWQEAWRSWRAHPVLGTGAGTFDLTHRKLRVDGTVATEPHNLPLQFLSETGIFGFILFLGIALAGAGALVETLRRLEGEDRLAAAALVVALFAYVVHGVVDFDWDFIAVTAPAVAVLGVLLAAGRPARVRLRARRGVLAVAAGAFAAAALYSLASPWLAARRVDDAYAALSRGDAGAAVSDARSAHDLNPVSVDALLAWGLAEAARGDVAAAGRLYTKAISIQPDNWRPWYFRARLLEKIAGPKVALFDAQQAAARDPRGLAGAYAASLATAS